MENMILVLVGAWMVVGAHASVLQPKKVVYHLPNGETIPENIYNKGDILSVENDDVVFVGDYKKGLSIIQFQDDESGRCFVSALAGSGLETDLENNEEGDVEGTESGTVLMVDTGIEADPKLVSDETLDMCNGQLVWAIPKSADSEVRHRRGCLTVCGYVCAGGRCYRRCYRRCW